MVMQETRQIVSCLVFVAPCFVQEVYFVIAPSFRLYNVVLSFERNDDRMSTVHPFCVSLSALDLYLLNTLFNAVWFTSSLVVALIWCDSQCSVILAVVSMSDSHQLVSPSKVVFSIVNYRIHRPERYQSLLVKWFHSVNLRQSSHTHSTNLYIHVVIGYM